MVSPILAPKSLGHPFVLLVVEVITMLCWLAAFIAEAVVLPNSDDCIGPVCSGAEAAIVFAALDWYVDTFNSIQFESNQIMRAFAHRPD
jgi:hypothetical protein